MEMFVFVQMVGMILGVRLLFVQMIVLEEEHANQLTLQHVTVTIHGQELIVPKSKELCRITIVDLSSILKLQYMYLLVELSFWLLL